MERNAPKVLADLKRWIKSRNELVDAVGQIAVTEFKLNFRRQGFNGNSWAPRKKEEARSRLILIKTGALRRSIRVVKKTRDSVTIGSNLPYAQIHNEGGDISRKASNKVLNFRRTDNDYNHKTKKYGQGAKFSSSKKAHFSQRVKVKSYTSKMPKRQFIGEMPIINKKIKMLVDRAIKNIIK